jgi:ethanolamine-phosphate cytidylyltransferase
MDDIPIPKVPDLGQWPVDPQSDIEISQARIWIDGCFDFSHHGMSG